MRCFLGWAAGGLHSSSAVNDAKNISMKARRMHHGFGAGESGPGSCS